MPRFKNTRTGSIVNVPAGLGDLLDADWRPVDEPSALPDETPPDDGDGPEEARASGKTKK